MIFILSVSATRGDCRAAALRSPASATAPLLLTGARQHPTGGSRGALSPPAPPGGPGGGRVRGDPGNLFIGVHTHVTRYMYLRVVVLHRLDAQSDGTLKAADVPLEAARCAVLPSTS